MATGGTGDILSGIIGRFVAGWKNQSTRDRHAKLSDFVCAAVYLHGLAGDLAAEKEGMESLIATDLLKYLPDAFKRVSVQ
jgi:NAD(P)H-hydrate epimerase